MTALGSSKIWILVPDWSRLKSSEPKAGDVTRMIGPLYFNNCFIFLCRSSLLLFVQKLYHLLFTRPTQHLSFALNHLSWARETNCLNCYLLLLFQCYYYLSTINLLFCDEWHIGLTVFLWASTTLTKVMWCLRYYEIYTLSRLLDICHIGLFYF